MDELRSKFCMCITCESERDENCEILKRFYEALGQDNVSVAITGVENIKVLVINIFFIKNKSTN